MEAKSQQTNQMTDITFQITPDGWSSAVKLECDRPLVSTQNTNRPSIILN